jgi:PAS domain S-box-containing protein
MASENVPELLRDGALAWLAPILSASGDALIALTPAAIIAGWNESAEQIYGYSAQEAIGRPLRLLVPDELEAEFKRLLALLKRGAQIPRYQTQRLRKDETRIDVSISLTPVCDADGRLAAAVSIDRDVTERKRAETERQELLERERIARAEAETAERRLRALVENAADIIVILDNEGHVRYASPATTRVLGYRIAPAPDVDVFSIVHPSDAERVRHSFMNTLRDPGVHPWIEFRVQHADGSWRTVEAATNVRFDDPSIRGAIVNLRDVTQRKQAEERLRFLAEASRILAESLDYETTLARVARLALPVLADWCAVHLVEDGGQTRRTGLAHVDPEHEALLQELRRHYPLDLESQHPVAQVLRSGQPAFYPEPPPGFFDRIAQDARHRGILDRLGIVSYLCVPLVARGRTLGAIACVLVTPGRRYGSDDLALAEDLAHRAAIAVDNARLFRQEQEARREQEAALAEARAALAVRDVFLGLAAHELRTPLTSLRGYLQYAAKRLKRGAAPESIEEFVGRASLQVDRLVGLVRDLLDVSRMTAGELMIERTPVMLLPILEEVIEIERAAEPERRIDLILPPSSPLLEADASRLEQVLFNLLQNARKYSPRTAPVEVRVEVLETAVAISVRDLGIGVPNDEQEQIFDRFQRASNVDPRRIPGLGLGLHISREIVRAHGGSLSVESTPGEGSTFTVTLPLTP